MGNFGSGLVQGWAQGQELINQRNQIVAQKQYWSALEKTQTAQAELQQLQTKKLMQDLQRAADREKAIRQFLELGPEQDLPPGLMTPPPAISPSPNPQPPVQIVPPPLLLSQSNLKGTMTGEEHAVPASMPMPEATPTGMPPAQTSRKIQIPPALKERITMTYLMGGSEKDVVDAMQDYYKEEQQHKLKTTVPEYTRMTPVMQEGLPLGFMDPVTRQFIPAQGPAGTMTLKKPEKPPTISSTDIERAAAGEAVPGITTEQAQKIIQGKVAREKEVFQFREGEQAKRRLAEAPAIAEATARAQAQVKRETDLSAAVNMVGGMTDMLQQLFVPGKEGSYSRFKRGLNLRLETATNPMVGKWNQMVDGLRAQWARAGGEVGNLAQAEQQRAADLPPDPFGKPIERFPFFKLPDTQEVARDKIELIGEFLQASLEAPKGKDEQSKVQAKLRGVLKRLDAIDPPSTGKFDDLSRVLSPTQHAVFTTTMNLYEQGNMQEKEFVNAITPLFPTPEIAQKISAAVIESVKRMRTKKLMKKAS